MGTSLPWGLSVARKMAILPSAHTEALGVGREGFSWVPAISSSPGPKEAEVGLSSLMALVAPMENSGFRPRIHLLSIWPNST